MTTQAMRIAVLVPCFNEEVTIGPVVRGFRASLPEATVYVYDNNSSDRTAAATVRTKSADRGQIVSKIFEKSNALCVMLLDVSST